MSKYSDPITATGSLITFDAPSGGVFDSLSVPIAPTQDLHGYDRPWGPGGGVNLFDKDNVEWFNGIGSRGNQNKYGHAFTAPGTYALKLYGTSSTSRPQYFIKYADNTWLDATSISTGKIVTIASGDTLYAIWGGYTPSDTEAYKAQAIASFNEWKVQVALSSTQPSQWHPYSNVCPISGLTGLSVYVGPTQDPDDATEYSVTFPEVLAGFIDPITGESKKRPQYSSYNGEQLSGPWMSSMDGYSHGTTPTIGAQVVDLGGALTTGSFSPVRITMLDGRNNVWVNTGAVITLIYRLLQTDRKIERTSIGKRAESLDVLGKFSSISKVEVNVTENLFYEAGDSSGRTLTVDCPFGTQEMADNLLAMLEGFYYQPYDARKAILDPAFEIGDGVTVGDVYGGIFSIHQKCGPLHLADLSAPADEEIDHEYKFTPAAERKIERRLNNMESELSVQAGEISAKVDRQGGDPSSVSWLMDSDVFKVQADGQDVLIVDENGLTVNGDGNFTGEVHAGNIRYGGSSGTFSGGGISGGSIGTSKFTSGINISLGNADFSADVFSGAATAQWTKANNILVQAGGLLYVVGSAKIKYGNSYASWQSKVVKDSGGSNITIHYLGF